MLLSKNYSRLILSARREKEPLPGSVLMYVICYSSGQHGRGDYPDTPAGDPLTRGSASWSIMDVDEEYDLPELKELVGRPVQIWTGNGWGSYHERSLTVFLVAPNLSGFKTEASNIKLVGEFPFRSLKQSCKALIDRLGLRQEPYDDDLPKLDVPESPEGFSGEGSEKAPRPSIETPDKPKPGETSQQYWDRIRQEKIGKYPYKYSGD